MSHVHLYLYLYFIHTYMYVYMYMYPGIKKKQFSKFFSIFFTGPKYIR
jgi:hypothetical protein